LSPCPPFALPGPSHSPFISFLDTGRFARSGDDKPFHLLLRESVGSCSSCLGRSDKPPILPPPFPDVGPPCVCRSVRRLSLGSSQQVSLIFRPFLFFFLLTFLFLRVDLLEPFTPTYDAWPLLRLKMLCLRVPKSPIRKYALPSGLFQSAMRFWRPPVPVGKRSSRPNSPFSPSLTERPILWEFSAALVRPFPLPFNPFSVSSMVDLHPLSLVSSSSPCPLPLRADFLGILEPFSTLPAPSVERRRLQ